MYTNEDVHGSTMSLTIDELRWLHFSRTMDLQSTPSRSPLLVKQHQPSQSYDIDDASIASNRNHNGSDTSFRLRRTSVSALKSEPKSGSIPIRIIGGSRHPQLSPRTPSHGVSQSLPTSSPCQEWIYRRPNKTTGHLQSHSFAAVSTLSRGRCRHSMDHDKQTAHSPLTATASSAESDAIPFWSTILRSRSHSERFNPSLKAKPSRAQLVISRPFTPLPTISSSPIETTFISTTVKHSHLRTPSMTSTASTASTSSTSRLCTPTLSYNPKRHQQKEINQISLSLSQGRRARSGSDRTPLSSSCPPCKSILARSSSLSTRGSHTTSATSGCSLSKSVKFVDIPTVHYPNADHLDFNDLSKIGTSRQISETQMGIDVEGMDLGYDDDGPETKVEDVEAERDALRNAPTLNRECERAAALKRVPSLKHRPPSSESRSNCGLSEPNPRPAISGPYALGTAHTSSIGDRALPAPIIPPPPSRRTKDTPLPPLPVSSQVKNRLRSASSMESVKSTLSTGARSILGLGSLKINTTRAWFGRSFGPGIKINFGIGWSLI